MEREINHVQVQHVFLRVLRKQTATTTTYRKQKKANTNLTSTKINSYDSFVNSKRKEKKLIIN